MNRIISTSELRGGNLNDAQVKQVRAINLSPQFDRKEKPWTLVKIPKSTTRNVAWHIRISGSDFLAIQSKIGGGEAVVIYPTDIKGKTVEWGKFTKKYLGYVDLEYAVDKFYQEEYEEETAQPESDKSSTEGEEN